MPFPKQSLLTQRRESPCRWCNAEPETFQGLCNGCDDELMRRWKEYEAATKVLVDREQDLFDMCFAAAFGRSMFHTVVFSQERLALRNIQDSHMEKMAGYYNDLRARRIASINRFLPTHSQRSISCTSSVPTYPVFHDERPVMLATRPDPPPSPSKNDNPLQSLRDEILVHWSEDADPRAAVFVNDSIHTVSFLKLLLKLAPHYSWEDTTRMVNSMIIERIRHGDQKQRCHMREDFWNVQEICRQIEFMPTKPDAITHEELTSLNCRIYHKWGLLKDGHDRTPEAQSDGVCTLRSSSCREVPAPAMAASVFTYQYRNRCRFPIGAVGNELGHAHTDEGYGSRSGESHAETQDVQNREKRIIW